MWFGVQVIFRIFWDFSGPASVVLRPPPTEALLLVSGHEEGAQSLHEPVLSDIIQYRFQVKRSQVEMEVI